MTTSRPALVLFVSLVLSVSFAVPAEDVLETSYYESESPPFEGTPLFSVAVTKTVAQAPHMRTRAPMFCLSSHEFGTRPLGQGTGSFHSICDSLTILDHSLRC